MPRGVHRVSDDFLLPSGGPSKCGLVTFAHSTHPRPRELVCGSPAAPGAGVSAASPAGPDLPSAARVGTCRHRAAPAVCRAGRGWLSPASAPEGSASTLRASGALRPHRPAGARSWPVASTWHGHCPAGGGAVRQSQFWSEEFFSFSARCCVVRVHSDPLGEITRRVPESGKGPVLDAASA